MFGSHLTGWKTNDNVYSTATSLAGPWSEWQPFAELESHTYNSQTSFVMPVGKNVVYMGDRWDAHNLMRSSYIWLPMELGKTTAIMQNRRNWLLDIYGRWSVGKPGRVYEAESADMLGDAKAVDCPRCSSGKAVGGFNSLSSGVSFSQITSDHQVYATLLVHYFNNDTDQRFGHVRVNGGPVQKIAFLPDENETAGPAMASINVALQKGTNDVRVLGADGRGPEVDKVELLYD